MHRLLCLLGIHHTELVGHEWDDSLFVRRCVVCKHSTIQ